MALKYSIKDMPRGVLEDNGSYICVFGATHNKSASYPKHTHTFSELTIIIEGQGEHIVDENVYKVEAGDVFVINGNMMHGFKNSRGLRYRVVMYEPNNPIIPLNELKQMNGFQCLFTLEPFYRKYHQFKNKLHLTPHQLTIAKELSDTMIRELDQKQDGYKIAIKTCFLNLLLFLSRTYEKNTKLFSRDLFNIADAITYIEKNYLEPITLKNIVARAAISRRHFLRLFKQNYNTTPINYLIKLRVDHACDLIKNNKLNISQAAFESGFSDSNYFSRKFKQIKGITPKEYKKNL